MPRARPERSSRGTADTDRGGGPCSDGRIESNIVVEACDPSSPEARAMSDALWEEVQLRYGFEAPNPFDPAEFTGPVGGFWLATTSDDRPVGSIALTPLDPPAAELDMVYVAPEYRRAGVAQLLLAALEAHARDAGVEVLRLRAGEPQPEALRFYTAAGFVPIPPFDKWVGDDTARCFEKLLT
jgi:putative acetyltransferase